MLDLLREELAVLIYKVEPAAVLRSGVVEPEFVSFSRIE